MNPSPIFCNEALNPYSPHTASLRNLASSCTALRFLRREASNSYKAIASFLAACCLFIALVSFSRAFFKSLYCDKAILFLAVASSKAFWDSFNASACLFSQNFNNSTAATTAKIAATSINKVPVPKPLIKPNTASAADASHVTPVNTICPAAACNDDSELAQLAIVCKNVDSVSPVLAKFNIWIAAPNPVDISCSACKAIFNPSTAGVNIGNTSANPDNVSLNCSVTPIIFPILPCTNSRFLEPCSLAYSWECW